MINTFPTIEKVSEYWQVFVESKHVEFTQDILMLSKNQKKVLAYLASFPTKNPSSHDVCHAIGVSEASVRQALKSLLLKDYLYKDKQTVIRVLDPAFRDFIRSI